MSGELEREDRIIGTALSRAVESQQVRETPFERSRLAALLAAPARSFPFGGLALAAAFLVLLAGGAFLLGRGGPAEPGASEPPVAVTHTPAPTATASATPLPDREFRVFFGRDQLPPLAKTVRVPVDPALEGVAARVTALILAHRAEGGAGAAAWRDLEVVSATTADDLARLALDGVTVRGSAAEIAFLQEIVYTATEEPGIRQVLLTDRVGGPLRLDQIVVDKAYPREEVFGYDLLGTDVPAIENPGDGMRLEIATWTYANSPAGTFGRLSVDVRPFGPPFEGQGTPPPVRLDPTLKAELTRCDAAACLGGKWRITLALPAEAPAGLPGATNAGAGPIRGVDRQVSGDSVLLSIYLDDARPWRVSLEPSGPRSARINVDVGGRPELVNRSIAVYEPAPASAVARTFTLAGAARVFEANVLWRLRDGRGNEVAKGFTTASLGTSPVWGTFETQVTVPASVSGTVTLEVLWASPRDGADMDVVSVPLTVR